MQAVSCPRETNQEMTLIQLSLLTFQLSRSASFFFLADNGCGLAGRHRLTFDSRTRSYPSPIAAISVGFTKPNICDGGEEEEEEDLASLAFL